MAAVNSCLRNISALCAVCCASLAQSVSLSWSGYGHDPQHTALTSVASQPLARIRWQTPVDLLPQFQGNDLLIHYGSPLVTAANTVIIPVKTGATDGFRVEARDGANGALKWSTDSDYTLPPHRWTPSFSPTLTPKNRLYFAGAGGSVFYRDQPDAASGNSGRIVFYGSANYAANPAAYNTNVKICTPLTTDRYGNIFFGFQVLGTTPVPMQSGIARISYNGVGSFWVSAAASAGDNSILKVVMNCAPALSNDHRTLYIAVNDVKFNGYLLMLDSRTLAPLGRVRLKDVVSGSDATLPDDGTASPTIGPDGDVYFGVLENPLSTDRGWLLHFSAALDRTKIPGAFGWDDTVSIVPASLIPSYAGASSYLVMAKYNNYAGVGGGVGLNQLAILDPNVAEADSRTGAIAMKSALTILGVTPDPEFSPMFPNAVREWCINNAAVDRFTRSILAGSEDGKLYRWDLTKNTFTETITLTPGVGEAYTPTLVGVDGTVYAINNATLFAVGQ